MGACDGDGENIFFIELLGSLSPETYYLVGDKEGSLVTFLRVPEVPKVGDKIVVTEECLPFPASFLPKGTYEVTSRRKDVSFSETIVFCCFSIKPIS